MGIFANRKLKIIVASLLLRNSESWMTDVRVGEKSVNLRYEVVKETLRVNVMDSIRIKTKGKGGNWRLTERVNKNTMKWFKSVEKIGER